MHSPDRRPLATALPPRPAGRLNSTPPSPEHPGFPHTQQQWTVTPLRTYCNDRPFKIRAQARRRPCGTSFRGGLAAVCCWWACLRQALNTHCSVPLSGALAPRLSIIKCSVWWDITKEENNRNTQITLLVGVLFPSLLMALFSSRNFLLEHRSLNIFNGISIHFLRLGCSSLYKGRPAPALSLKIRCPHLFPCLLNFSLYITIPLNTS